MSDEDILERDGTEEDIAMYAHDVGKACMYPDYPCEICEERERSKAKRIEVKKSQDYVVGYNKALNDMHDYLMGMFQADSDEETKETIGQIVQELKIPKEEW